MRVFLIVLFIGTSSTYAQQIDYNNKKGFVANGYDIVSYFNNEAIEGDKNFTTEYDGGKFKFSSQKNLDIFIANPVKYIPQYGGYCAYAVAEKGEKVGINPETFEIRDGILSFL